MSPYWIVGGVCLYAGLLLLVLGAVSMASKESRREEEDDRV